MSTSTDPLYGSRSFAGSAILLLLALGYGLTLGLTGPMDWVASALRDGSMKAVMSLGADSPPTQLGAALVGPLILPLAALTFAWGNASLVWGQITGAWLTHVCVNQSLFVVGSAPPGTMGNMASGLRYEALEALNLADHSFTLSAILFGIGFLVFTLTLTMPLFTGVTASPSPTNRNQAPRPHHHPREEGLSSSVWMSN